MEIHFSVGHFWEKRKSIRKVSVFLSYFIEVLHDVRIINKRILNHWLNFTVHGLLVLTMSLLM